MPEPLELVLIGLLGLTSAAAGAFWWRARSVPLLRCAQLARDLAERVKALEAMLEKAESESARSALGQRFRFDRPAARAPGGPTLIAVPDLSSPSGDATEAAAALARRFGGVWALADAGAPAEAIARTTGQPIGQVELILNLRRTLDQAAGGDSQRP